MKVIILAGGFGTRLRSCISNIPKPMAEINGKPFLEYILDYLIKHKISDVILCVGYKKNVIINHFKNKYKNLNIIYSSEDTPLGTGGAIRQAFNLLNDDCENVLVMNGDTFFNIDLEDFIKISKKLDYDILLSVKEIENNDRYGAVRINNNKVTGFEEKKFYDKAYINCGVYIINKNIFNNFNLSPTFSFEQFLHDNVTNLKIKPYISNKSYFIDIGVPEDYYKAKNDFKELF